MFHRSSRTDGTEVGDGGLDKPVDVLPLPERPHQAQAVPPGPSAAACPFSSGSHPGAMQSALATRSAGRSSLETMRPLTAKVLMGLAVPRLIDAPLLVARVTAVAVFVMVKRECTASLAAGR